MNYKRQARRFRKKYKLKSISSEKLIHALEEQGYTIIEYNGIDDDVNVVSLCSALNVRSYMLSTRGFTFSDDKYRLVFLHKDLNEEEKQIVLSHEQGHIINNHLLNNCALGQDVQQEYEANEFAHYLLCDRNGIKRKRTLLAVVIISVLLLGIGLGISLRYQQNKALYTDNYYRTETGKKYHLRDCMFIKDKNNVYRLTKEEFDSGEYEPCEACMPDER